MMRISFNTPCYYLTSVTHHRLPVFRTDTLKELLCTALNEVRTSSGMQFFAYVVMPDHVHIITDGKRSPSESLRYINGITARRIINYLKEEDFSSSLSKLKQENKNKDHQYSLWQHHSDKFLLTSESMFMQKVNYIHRNPVEDGYVERTDDYRYSSARIWMRKPLEDEPLEMNDNQIIWRQSLPRN